jgi:uncharacterized protein YegP (UPF0339 family)
VSREVYLVIERNAAGDYWWRAVGANHEPLATSEMLESKAACRNAIDVIRSGAAGAEVVDRTGDEPG